MGDGRTTCKEDAPHDGLISVRIRGGDAQGTVGRPARVGHALLHAAAIYVRFARKTRGDDGCVFLGTEITRQRFTTVSTKYLFHGRDRDGRHDGYFFPPVMPLSFNSFNSRATSGHDSSYEMRGAQPFRQSSHNLAQRYRPQATENGRINAFSAPCLTSCVENRFKNDTLIECWISVMLSERMQATPLALFWFSKRVRDEAVWYETLHNKSRGTGAPITRRCLRVFGYPCAECARIHQLCCLISEEGNIRDLPRLGQFLRLLSVTERRLRCGDRRHNLGIGRPRRGQIAHEDQ